MAVVRHNLPPAQWGAGLAVFTIDIVVGQIIRPSLLGWVAVGVTVGGGLARGFVLSAAASLLVAVLTWRQHNKRPRAPQSDRDPA